MAQFLMPECQPFEDSDSWIAERLRIDEETVMVFRRQLLAAGLWWYQDDKLRCESRYLNLREGLTADQAVAEFLAGAAAAMSLVSDSGPSWFAHVVVSTNEAVKKDFLSQVNQALQRFISQSQEIETKDTVLIWDHSSVDLLKTLEKEQS